MAGATPGYLKDRAQIQRLVELYRKAELLWDESHTDYYNRQKRQQTLDYMSSILGLSVKDLKKKIHSLRTSYSRQKSLIGSQQTQVKNPSKAPYYLFEELDKFLANHIRPKKSFRSADQSQSNSDTSPEPLDYSDHDTEFPTSSQDTEISENTHETSMEQDKPRSSSCILQSGIHYERRSDDGHNHSSLHPKETELNNNWKNSQKMKCTCHKIKPKLETVDLDAITDSNIPSHNNTNSGMGSCGGGTSHKTIMVTSMADRNRIIPIHLQTTTNTLEDASDTRTVPSTKATHDFQTSSISSSNQIDDAPVNLSLSKTRPYRQLSEEATTRISQSLSTTVYPNSPEQDVTCSTNSDGNYIISNGNEYSFPHLKQNSYEFLSRAQKTLDQINFQTQHRPFPVMHVQEQEPETSQPLIHSYTSTHPQVSNTAPDSYSPNYPPSPANKTSIKIEDNKDNNEAVIFGRMVALEWEKIPGARTRHIVKMKIQELLFEAQNEARS